jgi:hypothetical protein
MHVSLVTPQVTLSSVALPGPLHVGEAWSAGATASGQVFCGRSQQALKVKAASDVE